MLLSTYLYININIIIGLIGIGITKQLINNKIKNNRNNDPFKFINKPIFKLNKGILKLSDKSIQENKDYNNLANYISNNIFYNPINYLLVGDFYNSFKSLFIGLFDSIFGIFYRKLPSIEWLKIPIKKKQNWLLENGGYPMDLILFYH